MTWFHCMKSAYIPHSNLCTSYFFWEAIELLKLLSELVGGVGAIRNHVLGYVLNAFDLVLEGSL